ncbi:MAG TPA: prolyl oligopeptidase family serine peptidase [Candidatus Polarisedimenticolia bacterium]|nr:prolyl oligopeptidase family serine peptidase [Candidatus Polarisedimenticolia bacterium]
MAGLLMAGLAAETALSADSAAPAGVAGLYELEPQRVIGVTAIRDHLMFTDFGREMTGGPLAWDGEQLVARRASGDIVSLKPVLDGEGKVTSIVWSNPGEGSRQAKRLDFQRKEVSFSNGDVTLKGTLVLPQGKGRAPAVVRISGAGPTDRVNTIDEYFAYHGIAFLSYDKRGSGESQGDWKKAGVEDLANDAAAAVSFLAKQPEIDASRIGLGAGSVGGWVAAAVTGRVPHPAFVFMQAGPALSFSGELLYEAEAALATMGLTRKQFNDAMAYQKWKIKQIASGAVQTDRGWEALQQRTEQTKGQPWAEALAPWPRDSWRWENFRVMMPFDPAPYWEKYHGPVLALYGGKDDKVPAQRNADALRAALKRAGNLDVTVEIIPEADHAGMDATKKDGDIVTFAPGYLTRPLQWVLDRLNKK